ncbi:MAG: LLM class flavin-dependent oxidoreductase [SAR202 cluster bacterium]|nr:LLM class flavin-dependent oxidoreductase [SAR202 cluster bacterium]
MASSPVKVGLHVPAASTGQLPSGAQYIEFFKQAEALGYDSLWTEDRVFHDANFLESLTLLSWAAASTERIQLGTAVLLLTLRNAPALARQVSTMDHLSGGRLNLGISIGGRPNEYPGLGMRESSRVARLRENIAVLKQLLTGESVAYEGRFYQLDEAIVRPAVNRPGGVPMYMGGRVDAALRRAAELTDGWIGGPFSPAEDYRTSLATVHEYAKGFGRDPANMEAGKLIYVSVDDDKERALATLKPFIADYYGPRIDIAEHGVYGPPDEVAAQLRDFVDAGVNTFMLGVPALDIDHIERIAKEVVPRLSLDPGS